MSMRTSAKTAKNKYLIAGESYFWRTERRYVLWGFLVFGFFWGGGTLEVIHDNMLSYFLLCICNF